MRKSEYGQGLIEYPLILVLVAIVVSPILAQLGRQVNAVFCRIDYSLSGRRDGRFTLTESMDPTQISLNIDVKPALQDHLGGWADHCWQLVGGWDIDTTVTVGSVENHGDGTFTYTPDKVLFPDQDRFKFSYCVDMDICSSNNSVIIAITSLDGFVLESNLQEDRVVQKPTSKEPGLDEAILALWEASDEQGDIMSEGVGLMFEASVEGIEVLAEFAFENEFFSYAEIASQLIQAIRDSDMEAVESTYTLLGTMLFEAPEEIYITSITNMAPSLADSCAVMSAGVVSQETIDAAFQVVDPEDELALAFLEQAVGIIGTRNSMISDYLGYISTITGNVTADLYELGEDALADQLNIALAPCSP